jgi:hypothetical protein
MRARTLTEFARPAQILRLPGRHTHRGPQLTDSAIYRAQCHRSGWEAHPRGPINFFYVASRHGDKWLIEDGRAHFAPAPAGMTAQK